MPGKKLALDELGRKSVEAFKNAEKAPIVIILDNVRSLNNIGSVFRTADAFLVEAIYLCGYTGTPPHREIHKTALGATESVNWKHFQSTIDAVAELRTKGYSIISLEQTHDSISLVEYAPQKSAAGIGLVFGNEVNGVDQKVIDLSDHSIEIPQFGTKHSFNISVSVGIVLWDLYLKRKGHR